MTLDELINKIDTDKFELHSSTMITIKHLDNTYKHEDIFIDSCDIRIDGITHSISKVSLWKCEFNKINIKENLDIQYLSIIDSNISSVKIDNVLKKLAITESKMKNISIKNADMEYLSFFNTEINKIEISGSIKEIDFQSIYNVHKIIFFSLSNCEKFNIEFSESVIEKFILLMPSIKGMCYISADDKSRMEEFTIYNLKNIETMELKNLNIKMGQVISEKLFYRLPISMTNIKIEERFLIENIDLNSSIFKNINISKCIYNTCLVSEAKFYECSLDKIPDFPLRKVKKFIVINIASIISALVLTVIIINGFVNENLYAPVMNIVYILIVVFMFVNTLLFYKHSATLNEDREEKGKISWIHFIRILWKSTLTFFWKMDASKLQKLKEIETVNRQLKVAFAASKDIQNTHEFLYSEMLMKIRQKNIWNNLLSIDFWNYIINGFGRRWRRAFMNFVIMFFIAIFIFLDSSPFQFKVVERAPSFIQESNTTAFSEIPKEVLNQGLFANVDFNAKNKSEKKEEKDGLPILLSILELTSVYTFSKVDIMKIKTSGWFEETSTWNFFKGNTVGLILLFLFGSFVLAFKRRLEK